MYTRTVRVTCAILAHLTKVDLRVYETDAGIGGRMEYDRWGVRGPMENG